MKRNTTLTAFGILTLLMLVMTINVHAVPFTGDAWVALHIGENGPEGHVFVIDTGGIDIDLKSVKLNKFSIRQSSESLDFSDLTEGKNLLWFDIEPKNPKKYARLLKNGKLENRSFRFRFKDEEGNKFRGKASYATFRNPPGNNPSPVPEPATILLVGCGLLGLAGYGRKKIKN